MHKRRTAKKKVKEVVKVEENETTLSPLASDGSPLEVDEMEQYQEPVISLTYFNNLFFIYFNDLIFVGQENCCSDESITINGSRISR